MSSLMKENLRGPALTVDDLCKFVRGHFGSAAADIAQEHVDAYKQRGQNDVASTWSDVCTQLKKDDLISKRVA